MVKQGPKGKSEAASDHSPSAYANTSGANEQASSAEGANQSRTANRQAPASRTRVLSESGEIRGDSIGRFILLEVLGVGGMGTVFLGYDPMLNRRVAIKVLTSTDSSTAAGRLVREAQAMAKIQHPNVVTVFDAGEHEGQVFIAMEFVEGGTFREWMQDKREQGGARWQDVLPILMGAAEGLAAAHERELVHRDFKPENILISDTGEVKVADFGLVSTNMGPPLGEEAALPGDDLHSSFSSSSSSKRLTVAGTLMGTPFYMAPEQFGGTDVDAQADQFAFCIVLYEALYGQTPFVGGSFFELAHNVRLSKFAEVANEGAIPTWLRRIVLRGLAANPADRFPSMKALVYELARDRKSRVARASLAAVLVAAAAGTAWIMTGDTRASATCQDSQERLVGTWDQSLQDSIKAAFDKTGAAYVDAAWKTVHEHLDARASEWVSMRTETCEATRVHGTQSVELMDRRMACLERRRLEMSALTSNLVVADVEGIAHAAEAALRLEPLESCSLAVVMSEGEGEIIAPELRARVQELQMAESQAKAMMDLGQYAKGVAAAEEVFSSAEEIELFSLAAEAALIVGEAAWRQGDLEESMRWLIPAVAKAEWAGNPRVRVRALSELIYVIGYERAQPEEALHWGEIAEVVAKKYGVESYERGMLEVAIGATEFRARRSESALLRFKEALAIFEKAGDRLKTAQALTAIGDMAFFAGEFDEALAYHQKALAIRVAVLGATHPDTSESLHNIGSALVRQGKYTEARVQLREALRISQAAFGKMHPDVADSLNNLGAVDFAEGHYESALRNFERAIVIVEKAKGVDHADLAIDLQSAGDCYLALGRPAAAIPLLERTLDILQQNAARGEELAAVQFSLAGALVQSSDDLERARQLAENALLAYESNSEFAEQAADVREWLDAL